MNTAQLHDHLLALHAERAAAALDGIDDNDLYLEDLREEMEATHHALVGAAVTEIATFRALLSGPQVG
ncbi:MAG TPA: hypothetical protein VF533_11345 [Solirubrobacteraceae bacterium]|jgi:hypothetical protein